MPISEENLQEARRFLEALRAELEKVLIGQSTVVVDVITALVAGGHVLIEGVPGLGKTLLVKALARALKGEFSRIQFTPDLMPADVVGHTLYDAATNRFVTRSGPIFAHLLLADEINRAPAKTQSALLEAMQEGQVTLEGKSLPLPAPFMVLATQNPIEQEGTYPLPEAQLDRFLLKILIGYPSQAEEQALTRAVTEKSSAQWLNVDRVIPFASPEQVIALQTMAANVEIDERVLKYAVDIVRATRDDGALVAGAGPRGSIALIRAARARALFAGRGFATPDDVKSVALPALRHRVLVAAETEIEGVAVDSVLEGLLQRVPAPRQ
ncbi:MAG: AAA family ATPase [Burkholderiaceae bacterium]|jgi:MoxR-like ATPase